MKTIQSLTFLFSVSFAIAASSETCSRETCNGDETSLLQTSSKIKKHDMLEEQPIRDIIKDIKQKETGWADNIKLKVILKSGRNLPDVDGWFYGKSDPYCKIKLECDGCLGNKDGTEKTSPTVNENHNPNWNYLYETVDWNPGDKVYFECWDADVTSSDFMGSGWLTLTRGVAFDGTVSLYDRGSLGKGELKKDAKKGSKLSGYLKVSATWTHCTGDCEDTLITMAKLADYVYNFGEQAGNYHLIRKKDIQAGSATDNMGLYLRKGTKECALAFSGSNDAGDWVNNFNALATYNKCGYHKVHAGFMTETSRYFADSAMVTFSELIGEFCGGKVFSVGHSLGGAVASITAGCANSGGSGVLGIPSARSNIIPFTVSGLYTVGAPAVSKPQMTSKGGACFAGRRDFNYDSSTLDPVPLVAQAAGYRQPKVEALELHSNSAGTITKKTWACNSIQAEEYPYGLGARGPSIADHKTSTYITRLKDVFR